MKIIELQHCWLHPRLLPQKTPKRKNSMSFC